MSAVEMWGRSQPLTSPHRRARARARRTVRCAAACFVGIEAPAQKLVSLRLLLKQRTRVLAQVPRGSQLTTSKRPSPNASIPSGSPCTRPTPVSPGPPGLTNRVPIRCPGLLARWRISANLIVRPFGRSQSSGTGIVAHCRSSPWGLHSPQAIGSPTGPIARGAPESAATVSAAKSAARQIAASAAATTIVRRTTPTADPALMSSKDSLSATDSPPAGRTLSARVAAFKSMGWPNGTRRRSGRATLGASISSS